MGLKKVGSSNNGSGFNALICINESQIKIHRGGRSDAVYGQFGAEKLVLTIFRLG